MLSLKKYRFSNIGSFVSEQEIDLSDSSGLIQVNALNMNTSGSSGAGKSTTFHALDYLLGINDMPATALQSRITKSPMYVEGDFEVDGKPLFIKRCKRDGLLINFDGEEVSGNSKLAEEELDKIIGIPRDIFKKMVHKRQKQGGFFLNLTAKKTYEFLINALNLSEISKKTDIIDENSKSLEKRIRELELAQESLQSSSGELQDLLDQTQKPTMSTDLEAINLEKIKNVTLYKKDLEAIVEAKQSKISNIQKPILSTNIEVNPNIEIYKKQIQQLTLKKQDILMEKIEAEKEIDSLIRENSKKINDIQHYKSTMSQKMSDMKKLMDEKNHILESKCPTCSQTWIGDTADLKIQQINNNISKTKEIIIDLRDEISKEEEFKKTSNELNLKKQNVGSNFETTSLDKEKNDLEHKLVEAQTKDMSKEKELKIKYDSEINEYNKKIMKIEQDFSKKEKDLEIAITRTNGEIQNNTNEINNFKKNLASYERDFANINEKLQQKKEAIKECELELFRKNKERDVASESKRALKAYTMQIFQDSLDYIGSTASQMLSNIPNMSNASIYFEGCKENKNGNIKDEVTPIVNMDGYDNINIKTLSGGERTAIDLAVDLAVIDMLELKAGKGSDFFISDEPFEGLEDINISQCLEILKQMDSNKKIIIVDHNPIVKEMISDTIMIQKDGEESVVL